MIEKIKAEIERLKRKNEPFLSDFEKGVVEGNNDLAEELLSFIESLEKEQIPEWCGYPKELRCMSLANGYVNGKDFCKSCDAYKGEKKGYDEAYLQEKIALAKNNGSWREGPEKEKSEIPTIPQRLDEAAEDYAKSRSHLAKVPSGEIVNVYDVSAEEGFKAGVKWMAEQGVVADFEVNKLAARAWLTAADEDKFQKDIYDNFEAGDKVIVQIRKKDEKD